MAGKKESVKDNVTQRGDKILFILIVGTFFNYPTGIKIIWIIKPTIFYSV